MIFGNSLRRRLLEAGPDGRPRVVVRAFGKLPVASEFIDVGCDDLPYAQAFRTWIGDGWKLLEQATASNASAFAVHHVFLTFDNGKVAVIGNVWDSTDRPSQQGSSRRFPFALFVILPADGARGILRNVAPLGVRVGQQLKALRATLGDSADRAECATRIRGLRVALGDGPEDVQLADAAGQTRLADWAAGLPGAPSLAEFASGLANFAAFHRRQEKQRRAVWRLPLATGVDTWTQAAAWLHWLDQNMSPRGDVGVFVPAEASETGPHEIAVAGGSAQGSDFVLLSGDAEVVARVAPTVRPGEGNSEWLATATWAQPILGADARLSDLPLVRLPRRL